MPLNVAKVIDGSALQNGQQLFQSDLAFANDDDVRTRSEILVGVDAGFRATDDGFPPGLLCRPENLQHTAPRHEIGVNAKDRRFLDFKQAQQFTSRRKRRIENLDFKFAGSQV